MTVSLLYGQQVDDLEPLVDVARMCEQTDRALWLGQSLKLESHAALAALAGRGIAIETGIAVALAPLRTPYDALTQARSVAALTGRRIRVAYGIGSAAMATGLLGAPLRKPATYTAEYVRQVKTLQSAGHGGLRPMPMDFPAVEVGCGVLRPAMARKAAEVADFVATWLTPPDYLRTTLLEALDAGASDAGRKRPRVVAIVPCAVDRPGRNPVRLAAGSCGQHVQLPHYADMLRTAGVPLTGDRVGDLRAALRAGLFTYGSVTEIGAAVHSLLLDGIDEVVLNLGSVGLEHGIAAVVQDAEEIFSALPKVTTTKGKSDVLS